MFPWLTVALLLLLLSMASAATLTVLLAVEGMTGGTWPLTVKRALEGLKGVARADVSFRDKEARGRITRRRGTVEQMIAAVNRAGFRASVKRQGE